MKNTENCTYCMTSAKRSIVFTALQAIESSVTCFSFVFQAWPEDALEMVANKFLDEVEMSREVRGECVSLCKHFHQSVRGISER